MFLNRVWLQKRNEVRTELVEAPGLKKLLVRKKKKEQLYYPFPRSSPPLSLYNYLIYPFLYIADWLFIYRYYTRVHDTLIRHIYKQLFYIVIID